MTKERGIKTPRAPKNKRLDKEAIAGLPIPETTTGFRDPHEGEKYPQQEKGDRLWRFLGGDRRL